MRLERVGGNQIKITLTYEELADHGFSEEDVGKDPSKWNQLFINIINVASKEYEILLEDTVLIDIFSFHSQGMVLVITLIENDDFFDLVDDTREMEWEDALSASNSLFYIFEEIEDVIQFSIRIYPKFQGGQLLSYNEKYYLFLYIANESLLSNISSLASEYGDPATIGFPFVQEYGKIIISENAIQQLNHYFNG
ncbi:adaptor protein MecA [Caldibacillus lycopersici]|uniref:Adaptor protein MecA n=1 Tax=Perspicuibacillus lycopersici TaxID=1325689 RepID=A0AAE3ISS1_9BACI|nr:adaptor protein MecA [Perspicuibacillus lycopersici]MCU9613732.1 adaptor protein MecA [Perspicuibacillus lycopersici]